MFDRNDHIKFTRNIIILGFFLNSKYVDSISAIKKLYRN
jgi:hypothetical protein